MDSSEVQKIKHSKEATFYLLQQKQKELEQLLVAEAQSLPGLYHPEA